MRYIYLLLATLLTSNTLKAQCAGQVDSAIVTIAAEHCGKANGEIIITSVRGGITNPAQIKQYQLNGGAQQASNIFAALTAGNYNLTVTETPSGCVYKLHNPIVIVNKTDFTNITETHTAVNACNANNAVITVVATGGVLPNQYQLDGGAFQNSLMFMNVSAGVHYVLVKDSKGCDTIISVTVPQVAGITFVDYKEYPTACNGNSGSVKIKSLTGTTPTTMQIDGGAAILYNDSIINLAAGNHTIVLQDAGGCKFALNTIYIRLAPPYNDYTVHVVSDTCSKNVGKIFITNNAGGAVPATFAIDASTTYTANALFINLAKGQHVLHIKDNNNCLKDTTLSIPTTYKPKGTPVVTNANCGKNDGAINVTNVTGAAGPYTFTCNGTTSNGTNPFMALAKGTYTITIKDAFGCDSSQQATVDELNKILSINALLTNVTCGSSFGSIEVISVGGGVGPYTYTFNGASQTSTTKGSLPQGTYAIKITDVNNCMYDTAVSITQINPLTCTLTATPSSIFTSESCTITSDAKGITNVWKGSGAETQTTTSITVTPLATTLYTLTTSTPEGCEATCSTTVIVQPRIIAYKAFSPNDDTKNDTWEITYMSFYPDAEISVFSRWGQLVYKKKKEDSYTPFDGKSTTGSKLTTGTYFYNINLNVKDVSDDFNEYKGFVEIIQ
jgi:large repetitive protein